MSGQTADTATTAATAAATAYHGTPPWMHHVSVAAAVLGPIGLLLPPRRMGARSLLLAGGAFFASSQLTYDYTGQSICQRFQRRMSAMTDSDLPAAAVQRQAAMRAERERRRLATETAETAEAGSEAQPGTLHKIWMGSEKEDWTRERARREKEVLEAGGGYWELIVEQIGDGPRKQASQPCHFPASRLAMSRSYADNYVSGALPLPPYQRDNNSAQRPSQQQWHQSSSADSYSGTTVVGGSSTPVGASTSNLSPFDTVFDDHMYPAGTYQQQQSLPGQQQQHEPDTAYYGARRTPSQENMLQAVDGIPLRDRGGGGMDSPDHVYDIPQGGTSKHKQQQQQQTSKGPVRFGELGMFGASRRRIPYVVYLLTTVQVAVFIAEIVRNGILTGSPIMIHPSFNVMIGPSTYVMINMGSRFVPCMHNVAGVQSATETISWPCPNTTTSDALCTLSQLCGFGGVPEPAYDGNADQSPQPDQWFRFIVPMFMHAGLIHIGFNMMLQLTMGRDMERAIGSIRFFIVYICSGIFGFVLGGNYAATGISSTGASGALFGVIALTLLDLLYSWRDRRNPVKDLMFIFLDVLISFVLGLLPGLDNFSHIGGFFMGLALGVSVLHSPNALRRRVGEENATYAAVNATYTSPTASGVAAFVRNPLATFRNRRPLWWAWWLLRVGFVVLVIVLFVLLLKNFYVYRKTCGWCKYLSCLPVHNWCNIGNLQLTNTTTKRDVLGLSRFATFV
ncbi:rhomboid family membrane protein [Grosmannia clavigera kw1407]|uniref:Rhomboid-type serine protease n=1 Tax=Grosmannia clavigera (strain kw1407 / UAMH 11150) TaxID=655863 RepID=F0X8U7_GROCL|nr:rhomboid family membrane protein [Grosmannia clavigera kw1407]EFX05354.1 rhomboid family membrane protein [Grosmannia clavigera kw1407]